MAEPERPEERTLAMQREYTADAPAREDVDALPGATVVEFGTNWCGHCTAAQPLISDAFASHRNVRHLKVEDGPGRRLGRSYRIKLWPTTGPVSRPSRRACWRCR